MPKAHTRASGSRRLFGRWSWRGNPFARWCFVDLLLVPSRSGSEGRGGRGGDGRCCGAGAAGGLGGAASRSGRRIGSADCGAGATSIPRFSAKLSQSPGVGFGKGDAAGLTRGSRRGGAGSAPRVVRWAVREWLLTRGPVHPNSMNSQDFPCSVHGQFWFGPPGSRPLLLPICDTLSQYKAFQTARIAGLRAGSTLCRTDRKRFALSAGAFYQQFGREAWHAFR